ncbi:MAG: acyl-ACP--UDP-N-acetylglucosamine O-acyltransferase [Gemmatimonadota bacterium]
MNIRTPTASPSVHPTALLDADARIDPSVVIGPYSIVGPGVEIDEEVIIAGHVLIGRDTRIGEGCRIHHGAVLGTDPQDLKYRGERSRLDVGPRTVIREYATLNRGTGENGLTRVGSDCLLMAYSHVAHDCSLGNGVILANSVNLAGHVQIGSSAIVGGLVGIHQFVRIGEHAFVGACSKLAQDIPPFLLVDGNPCGPRGLNVVGLRRRGFSQETILDLRRAYRLVFASDLNIGAALDAIEAWPEVIPEVAQFVEFIRTTERGIVS